MNAPERVQLSFEGVIAFPVADPGAATHFFEHVLGLQVTAEDGALRFYSLTDELAIALDASGESEREPYLLFSAQNITAAAEHFLQQECLVRELSWAPGAGFLARSAEGFTVCVVDQEALHQDE